MNINKHDWINAVCESELEPSSRLICLYLATHLNTWGEAVYPSLSTISRRTGLHKATVIRHLDQIKAEGFVAVSEAGGIVDGKNKSTRYVMTMPGVVAPCDHGSRTVQPRVVAPCDTNSPLELSNEVSKKRSMSGSRLTRTDEILKTATEVIDWLNIKTGKKFQAVNGTLRPVVARLRELTGPDYRFDLDAAKTICMTVVADQTEKWIGDEKMRDYLTTKTLFRDSNFCNYAADIIAHNITLRDEQCTNAQSATHRSTQISPTFAPTDDAPGNDRSESQTESLPLHEIFSHRLSQKNAQH